MPSDATPTGVRVLRDDDPQAGELLAAGVPVLSRSWGAVLRVGERLPVSHRVTLRALVDRLRDEGLSVEELTVDGAAALLALQDANRADYSHDPALALPPADLDRTRAEWDGGRVFAARAPDGRLVGATVVRRDGEVAQTTFTSVLREFRRRGVASAVKAASVLALADDGVREFRTGGAEDNLASLGANRALGYEVAEHWLTFPAS